MEPSEDQPQPFGFATRAIHVGQDYENAEYTRDRFIYDLDRLMHQDHEVTGLWDPSDPRGQ